MALSMISFIAMSVGSREMAASLSIQQILFFHALVGVGVIIAVGRSLLPEIRRMQALPLHLARNIVHFTAHYFWTIGMIDPAAGVVLIAAAGYG